MEPLILSYAGSAVRVEPFGAAAEEIARFVCGGMVGDPGQVAPHATYRLAPSSPGRHALYRDTVLLRDEDDLAELGEHLMGGVSFDLADRSAGGLLFHSGAVVSAAGAVFIPGGIGAGKSTLTLFLASQGYPYLSDEMVFVPDGTSDADPLRRPLNLKRAAIPTARAFFPPPEKPGMVVATAGGEMIHPSLLPSPAASDPVPAGCLVFPSWEADATGSFEELSRAQAGFALMRSLVNARNLPEHGFPEIVRLAAAVPACRIRYSRFDQIEGKLLAWLRTP
jgi:hypothetical protein